jgi:hypothetical protein
MPPTSCRFDFIRRPLAALPWFLSLADDFVDFSISFSDGWLKLAFPPFN